MTQEGNKPKKFLVGTVVSDKMDKTVVVSVPRTYVHPLVKKVVRVNKKYKAHDPGSIAKEGDLVEIYEGRPVSKTKYMYVSRVVESKLA